MDARKGSRKEGKKENTPLGELKPLGMHAEFQKQRTEKKRIKIKSRVEKKDGGWKGKRALLFCKTQAKA